MNLPGLLESLRALPHETEWVEFKHNKVDPEEIGEYISALSNSATLTGKAHGYLVWGVADATHEIVGTTFSPGSCKVGNQDIEPWLVQLVTPKITLKFFIWAPNNLRVVILEIEAARQEPTRFKSSEFIRIGSYKKSLKDHPDRERALWAHFAKRPTESAAAKVGVTESELLELLDYPAYFELTTQPLPENRSGIVEKLLVEGFASKQLDGAYEITILGALLFARQLDKFSQLGRKALRVVFYKGVNRVETEREQTGTRGYAGGFKGAIKYLNERLPRNELIEQALRRDVAMYPELALRELVANALIHQDLSVSGSGPMVEVFADRIEVSNPGTPLNEVARLIDLPPRSRNEALAAFMRRIGFCEERGSGIDKVIFEIEKFQLPPPDFRVAGYNTLAVMYAPAKLTAMSLEDRIRACYQHACLMYVSNRKMTNSSLRDRFGVAASNSAVISRLIKEALTAGVVKIADPANQSKKDRAYLPDWA
jgi:ATP-dependent DNA helicase RecG